MNASIKSSAVAYLASKETDILPSRFERMAAANRLAIKRGKVWGLTFPAPKDNRGRGGIFTKSREDRVATVEEISALRRTGVKARDAAKACGTTYQTYRRWADELGVNETFNSRWDNR